MHAYRKIFAPMHTQKHFLPYTFVAVSMMAICSIPLAARQPTVTRLDGSKITSSQIDSTVTHLMEASHVTGAGIAIFNDGKIAYLKTYGVRDKEKLLPLTLDSVMPAASLTKSAFATMVMQLVRQKVIDLDKPIYEYLPKPLPEYPGYKDLAPDPRYRQITMRMLLDHTSGFPNWRWFTDDKKLSIYFMPGSRFAYSGEGIALAQMVVETVTSKSVQDLMEGHIFKPLGMTSTSMIWEPRFEGDYANGYDEQEKSLGAQRRTKAGAAGSMQTTLRDFALFVRAVIDGTILEKKTRALMLTPQIRITSKHMFPTLASETTTENENIQLSSGLGWGLYRTPYGMAFFKGGHDDGWRHYVVCFDRPKAGILIMTNSSNGDEIFISLLEDLLRNTFTPLEWERFKPVIKN
jgi:CubicO group peptidase (beta-lactamase class C family)